MKISDESFTEAIKLVGNKDNFDTLLEEIKQDLSDEVYQLVLLGSILNIEMIRGFIIGFKMYKLEVQKREVEELERIIL